MSKVAPWKHAVGTVGHGDFESEFQTSVGFGEPGAEEEEAAGAAPDHLGGASVETLIKSIHNVRCTFVHKDVEVLFKEERQQMRDQDHFRFLRTTEDTYVFIFGAVFAGHAWAVVNGTNDHILFEVGFAQVGVALTAIAYMRWLMVRSFEFFHTNNDTSGFLAAVATAVSVPLFESHDEECATSNLDVVRAACEAVARQEAAGKASFLFLGSVLGFVLLSPVDTWAFVKIAAGGAVAVFVECALVSADASLKSLLAAIIVLPLCALVIFVSEKQAKLARENWITSEGVASSKARQILLAWHLGATGSTVVGHTGSKHSVLLNASETDSNDVKGFFDALREHQTMARLRIDENDLEVLDYLGRGAMGEVFESIYMEAPVVLKRLPSAMLTQRACAEFIAEVKILKGLRHPNVVQLMGVFWQEATEMAGMVLELMGRGSLRSVLLDRRIALLWEDPKAKLAVDIAKGMAFLHAQKIIHRDLKTDNILVSSTFTGKVSDFGTSRIVHELCKTPVGTPLWRAPEMFRAEKYSFKADVYSFGIILLELHTHQNPFEHMSQMDCMEFPHMVAHDAYRLPIPDDVPGDIRAIINDCWAENPEARPSFTLIRRRLSQFLAHINNEEDPREEKHLNKIMLDQIIMSGCYTKEKYADGDFILRSGDDGDTCYIVLSGQVDIFVPASATPGGAVVDEATFPVGWRCVHTAGEGEFFGETAMLVRQKRTATCCAKGSATVINFDNDAFVQNLDGDIQALLAQRIVENMQNAARNIEGRQATDEEKKSHIELQRAILDRSDTWRTHGSNGTQVGDKSSFKSQSSLAQSFKQSSPGPMGVMHKDTTRQSAPMLETLVSVGANLGVEANVQVTHLQTTKEDASRPPAETPAPQIPGATMPCDT